MLLSGATMDGKTARVTVQDGQRALSGSNLAQAAGGVTIMAKPHSIEDEVVATEAVDVGTLLKENASLQDRLLRALADAENTRRQASRTAGEARRFANVEFARELLIVVDNL